MKNLNFEYTNSLVQDSITQEFSSRGALIITSHARVYFITKEFIDWAYNILYERKNEHKT